ncbi:DUF1439 domain-containing protein [Alkalimonas amylolytica]|uniref:DUF1439 domain-containing protein n=1 Tax=Alkalimonas amylolytica TaxID=152573 RepID=A0A1H4D7J0_ALKAM|nr:DUF1439 domain-containing protein [Alkalimonas amylolytica]SEA68389.1 Protein of unknown function [Alkalimonas amylolytica]
MTLLRMMWLGVGLLLAGCAQVSDLASYSVTEQQLQQLMLRQLDQLTQQTRLAGMPVALAVEDMQVRIGPDNSDVVRLGTKASAVFSAFGLHYPASLQLQIEASPYYDGEQNAVFLRNLRLLDSSIDAAGYRGNLAPLSTEVLQLVNAWLQDQPVYRLDENDPTQRLLMQMPLNMAVQQGRIRFSPL